VTLKQKQNAERSWLRQELLVITKHLGALLGSSNLAENDKRLRALVHHIINRDWDNVGLYRNIHSRTLSSYLGNISTCKKWFQFAINSLYAYRMPVAMTP
jgi:hypothetical protein